MRSNGPNFHIFRASLWIEGELKAFSPEIQGAKVGYPQE
jgi:hypothetical protein